MTQSKKKILNIYTDGACSGNQNDRNLGGWGAILEYGEHIKELHGGEKDTTNNRMEMTALIAALSAVNKNGQRINVFSDSAYLTHCLRDRWYAKWQQNGWKTTAKSPVENRDLWEQLLAFLPVHDFGFFLVKGHINIESTRIDLSKVYEKFLANNARAFSYEDFLHITRMNNRADALAGVGISELQPSEAAE
jgi:ribonuclease HI